MIKRHHCFENGRIAADGFPCGIGIGGGCQSRLPLSVIAEPRRFEDRGRSDLRDRDIEIGTGIDARPRCRGPALCGCKFFLRNPVLRNPQRAQRRKEADTSPDFLQWASIDILEFISRDIDGIGKRRKR